MNCPHCGERTAASRPGTNHLLHFLATIVIGIVAFPVFGLLAFAAWLPVWVLSSIRIGGWRCNRCGTRARGPNIVVVAVLGLVLIYAALVIYYLY